MLLNEITTSDDLKIKKINDVLKETYGFTLVSEVKTGTLNTLYTKIADDLYNLKLDLGTAKSPAYMQKVLVLEGLKILITKNNKRLEEAAVMAGKGGRAFTRILAELTNFVDKVCDMGDDYEEAIKDAMKHYRSSKYRFQDEVVEYELRKATVDDCTDTVLDEVCEAVDCTECEKCECDPCECDKVEEGKLPDALKKHQFGAKDDDAEETDDKDDDKDDDDDKDGDDEVIEEDINPETGEEYQPGPGMSTRHGGPDGPQTRPAQKMVRFDRWWEFDKGAIMSQVYWQKSQLPPSDPEAYDRNWQKVKANLSAKYPAPEGAIEEDSFDGGEYTVISAAADDARDNELTNMGGFDSFKEAQAEVRDIYRDIQPYELRILKNGTPVAIWRKGFRLDEPSLEEGGDRHAEHDWVQTIKRDQGIGQDGDLAIDNPEDEGDADDFFSYQSKKTNKKRTEMKEGYVKELRKLLEAETDQAESLIAAKSFSQELQDMVEKLGRLVNENLPAVSEQMRDAYGSDVATGFEDQVSGTLNTVMDSLRNSKQEIDNSVSTIADGGAPQAANDMENFSDEELGGEFDADADLELDGDVELALDDELPGDEFGGDDAMAGLEDEPLGRAKKESIRILGKKLIETKAKLARIKARK
jgi:hypothetical protein